MGVPIRSTAAFVSGGSARQLDDTQRIPFQKKQVVWPLSSFSWGHEWCIMLAALFETNLDWAALEGMELWMTFVDDCMPQSKSLLALWYHSRVLSCPSSTLYNVIDSEKTITMKQNIHLCSHCYILLL
jgi:hypothetical protein